MTKIALVTGGNKGIGLATVRLLAERGITVLLGSRDELRGTQAAQQLTEQGLDVHYLYLDMEDSSSFSAAYNYIADTYGRLDILINNAGVQIESETWQTNTTENIPMEILRKTFDINFFGMVELTQKLLPLLRKSTAGRIVNLTSILGCIVYYRL